MRVLRVHGSSGDGSVSQVLCGPHADHELLLRGGQFLLLSCARDVQLCVRAPDHWRAVWCECALVCCGRGGPRAEASFHERADAVAALMLGVLL